MVSQALVEALEQKVQEAHQKGLEEAEVTNKQGEQQTAATSQEGGENEVKEDDGEKGLDDTQLPTQDKQQQLDSGEEERKENLQLERPTTPPPSSE